MKIILNQSAFNDINVELFTIKKYIRFHISISILRIYWIDKSNNLILYLVSDVWIKFKKRQFRLINYQTYIYL